MEKLDSIKEEIRLKFELIGTQWYDYTPTTCAIRFWGEWISPEEEEDCDWKLLSRNSHKKAKEIIKEIEQKFSVKINCCISEKCYLDFEIIKEV